MGTSRHRTPPAPVSAGPPKGARTADGGTLKIRKSRPNFKRDASNFEWTERDLGCFAIIVVVRFSQRRSTSWPPIFASLAFFQSGTAAGNGGGLVLLSVVTVYWIDALPNCASAFPPLLLVANAGFFKIVGTSKPGIKKVAILGVFDSAPKPIHGMVSR